MHHPATVVTQPTTFPITLTEVKAFLGIGVADTADDTLLNTLIAAATKYFQQATGHQLASATFLQVWDCFPTELRLDWMPVASVTWLKYYDVDGTLTTWDSANYWVSTAAHPPTIIPIYTESWPLTQAGRPESVRVQYVAGYADATGIEEGIEVALLNLVKHWFSQRDIVIATGAVPQKVPYTLENLMMMYSLRGYR